MSSATKAGATVAYKYNALGQRVLKTGPTTIVASGTLVLVYDEAGHVLGEYDASLRMQREYVYAGDTPVAVLTQTVTGTSPNFVFASALNYVFADHLDTPRIVTRPGDNKIIWRWDAADPFGAAVADENPSALGAFAMNLRFPGQYYDKESGLHYNYFRDYDPRIGRYVQSDPIGLKGGVNTYGYVSETPLIYVDPRGEDLIDIVDGALSVPRGVFRSLRYAARRAGILGNCEKERAELEGQVLLDGLEKYRNDPNFQKLVDRAAAEFYLREGDYLKGRITIPLAATLLGPPGTGVALGVGALNGDVRSAIEAGLPFAEAMARQGKLGR